MKTIAWLSAGFALIGVKGYLERADDLGLVTGGVAGDVPITGSLLATIALLAASTCFYRGLRSALAGLVRRRTPKEAASHSVPKPGPRPLSRIFAALAEAEFDPDAAFAHYMQQREAAREEAPGDPGANLTPRPHFGRKVL